MPLLFTIRAPPKTIHLAIAGRSGKPRLRLPLGLLTFKTSAKTKTIRHTDAPPPRREWAHGTASPLHPGGQLGALASPPPPCCPVASSKPRSSHAFNLAHKSAAWLPSLLHAELRPLGTGLPSRRGLVLISCSCNGVKLFFPSATPRAELWPLLLLPRGLWGPVVTPPRRDVCRVTAGSSPTQCLKGAAW